MDEPPQIGRTTAQATTTLATNVSHDGNRSVSNMLRFQCANVFVSGALCDLG
jgi:hypothetical protein